MSLTSLSHGAGCGCKLPPGAIAPLLAAIAAGTDPNVLVGFETADDAGVYRISDELALVQTVDFFTPIVDDPYEFGRIAAANALSDVYAMGATPVSALNLVAFPVQTLGADVLAEILRGGAAIAAEAGVAIIGGHSIDDPEPKYGMAVTGLVHPDRVLTNAGGQPGDALVLTKPLGAGAVATAAKHGLPAPVTEAIAVMTTLNRDAAAAARRAGAHGLTDVTGFGLLGHLHELAQASGLAAELDAAAVPAIAGVLPLLADPEERALAGGTRRNREYAAAFTTFAPGVSETRRWLLSDAMTSGGLLAALAPERAGEVPGPVIGHLAAGPAGQVGSADGDSAAGGARERQPDHEPGQDAGAAGDPARLTRGERHQQQDAGQDRRADQVALDLPPGAKVEQVGQRPGGEQRERRAVGADRDRDRVQRGRRSEPTDAAGHEQQQHRGRTVTTLEQPAEQGDRRQGHERVAGVRVGERRRDDAPPVTGRLADDRDLREVHERRAPQQAAGQAGDDQGDRRVRARVGGDPGNLAAAQARERGPGRPAQPLLGHASLAVDLRRPLAQAVAAVRTLGDVWAHL